jgi:hypothetical protein
MPGTASGFIKIRVASNTVKPVTFSGTTRRALFFNKKIKLKISHDL